MSATLVVSVVLVAVLCWIRVRVGGDGAPWAIAVVAPVLLWALAADIAVVVMWRGVREPDRPPRRSAGRVGATAAAVLLSPVLVVAGGGVWMVAENIGTPAPTARGGGTDALWLGHAWVDGRRTEADVRTLAGRMRESGIRDVYVHAGPLANDGSLDPTLRPAARWLIGSLHRAAPGVRAQAWLGNVVAADRLHLDDPLTRARVLGSAAQVLADGFDGIHYDVEPVAEGSRDFLELLTATRALTRSRDAILSVSANQIEPVPGAHLPGQWLFGRPHWWSSGFHSRVAALVDQIAIMTYDTGMPTEATYSGYLSVQTRLALRAVPPEVDLLIGIPAYHEVAGLHTGAETVAPAVRGLRLALGEHPPRRAVGAALYVDFTATPDDWTRYTTQWISPR